MKKSVMIPLIIVVAVIQFFGYIFLIASFLSFLSSSYASKAQKELPEPAITYAEFPCKVVYEIDGEQKVLKDTYICEYAGTDFDFASGAHRVWKGYVASNGNDNIVLISGELEAVVFDIGSPWYLMDDPLATTPSRDEFTPKLLLIDYAPGVGVRRTMTEEKMQEYKIKLISWELSEPIENSFGEE